MPGSFVARWARLGCALALALPTPGFAESVAASDMAAYQRLRTEFNLSLSEQLRGRPEPRLQLAAAILAVQWIPLLPSGGKQPGQEQFPAEGQAMFFAVRHGSTDPLVLRFAANRCRFDAAVCDADGAIAQLLAAQPRNAENLFIALDRANDRGDSTEVARLVGALAGADHFDGGYLEAWRWWLDVYRLVADDPRLSAVAGYSAEDARPLTPSIIVGSLAFSHAMALPVLGRGVLARECGVSAVGFAGQTRLSQCRKIAQHLRDVGPSQLDHRFGYTIGWGLAADDAERAALEAAWRQNEWSIANVPQPGQGVFADAATLRHASEQFIATLESGQTEAAAIAAARRAAGLPDEAPAAYRPPRTLAEMHAARERTAAAQ